jgi:hypothetical protein
MPSARPLLVLIFVFFVACVSALYGAEDTTIDLHALVKIRCSLQQCKHSLGHDSSSPETFTDFLLLAADETVFFFNGTVTAFPTQQANVSPQAVFLTFN